MDVFGIGLWDIALCFICALLSFLFLWFAKIVIQSYFPEGSKKMHLAGVGADVGYLLISVNLFAIGLELQNDFLMILSASLFILLLQETAKDFLRYKAVG